MISWATRRLRFGFAKLDNYYFIEASRPSAVFSVKNTTWSHGDVVNYAKALANGLKRLDIINGSVKLM